MLVIQNVCMKNLFISELECSNFEFLQFDVCKKNLLTITGRGCVVCRVRLAVAPCFWGKLSVKA